MSELEIKKPKFSSQLGYFAVHKAQLISGLIFFGAGVLSLIFYNYGMIEFLFPLPHFLVTGLLPLAAGFLILLRVFVESENVQIASNDTDLKIQTSWIKSRMIETVIIQKTDIQYFGIKYRETTAKRWVLITALVVIAIEVLYQHTIYLFGHSRFEYFLLIETIMLFVGIGIYVFLPQKVYRNWIE